jgi:hypothetical protein
MNGRTTPREGAGVGSEGEPEAALYTQHLGLLQLADQLLHPQVFSIFHDIDPGLAPLLLYCWDYDVTRGALRVLLIQIWGDIVWRG